MLRNRKYKNALYPPPLAQAAKLAGLAALVTLLPLLLWRWDPGFIRFTYSKAYQPFELFGFCAGLAMAGLGAWQLRQRPQEWRELLPVLLPLGLGFFFLNQIVEYSAPSWDYNCYRQAAEAIIRGANPYNVCYLYPPLLAQSLVYLSAGLALTFQLTADEGWDIVFYLFQCIQFFLLLLSCWLLVRFGRKLGLSRLAALLLVAALMLVNTPLQRTLGHNQVNLAVLVLTLAAILEQDRRPWLAGLAAALGTHLKLYSAVLLGPWLLTRRWRPLLAALGGLAGVALFSELLLDQPIWQQFLAAAADFPRGTYYRDNSLHSVVHNTVRLFTSPAEIGLTFRYIVLGGTALLSLLVLLWLGRRYLARERAFAGRPDDPGRIYGHLMDALALSLMVAPRVWEHHYVLAMPILLWGAAGRGRQRPWQMGIAAFLIFALPTFDIFPLSYHRLVGLVLLLKAAE